MGRTKFNTEILPLRDSFYRMARSILRNSEEAQDAVQDLLEHFWEKGEGLNGIENLSAFAYRSLRNRCLDMLRQRRDTEDSLPEREAEQPNPHEMTEQRDMVNRVYEIIESLPELQRTIVRMRDVEGMEIDEIAFITETSANAVSANLSRARKKIREQLIKEIGS